jgi:acetoin:2,6-dichlorophenolindophenol oxidoreductase subunit beta
MTPVTYSQAFQQGMREEMARDERIFVLGTDLLDRGGHFGQVLGLGKEFGAERVRDMPISEAAMVAAGVGAALNGMRPVVDLNFIDFSFGAMDEIVNQAAKMRYMFGTPMPLVIRGTSGVALYAAQHNNSLESVFAHMPGLLVAIPSTPADTKGLLKSALRGEDPVIFMMHKRLSGTRGEVGGPEDIVPFGLAAVRRSGGDVTIVAYSHMVFKAMEAAERLAADGIEAEVIDLRTVMPLDFDTVAESVRKTGRLVAVTEAPCFGSIAAEVAARIQETVFDWLSAPVVRVGAKHAPIAHSPALYEAEIPQSADIERAARTLVTRAES